MTLSPAAQAVLDAAVGYPAFATKKRIAAALRAAEDQLANDKPPAMGRDEEIAVLTERIRLFRIITAIATELENAS